MIFNIYFFVTHKQLSITKVLIRPGSYMNNKMTIKTYFNPGCALSIYKPEMVNRILNYLNQNYQKTSMHKYVAAMSPGLKRDH